MPVGLRPKLVLRTPLSVQEVMNRFRAFIGTGQSPCHISLLENQIEISMRPETLHFWSPFLNILIDTEDDQTVLRGKFGPNVNLWTLFVALYSILGLIGATGLLAATSQLQLGQSPTGFWLSAFSAVAAAVVWIAGRLGQRLARDQITTIEAFVREVLDLSDPPPEFPSP